MSTEQENKAWNTIEELKGRVLSGFATRKELLMYTNYTDTLAEVKDKIEAAIIVCKAFGKIKDGPWEKLSPELIKEAQQFKAKYERLKNNITGSTNIELEFKLAWDGDHIELDWNNGEICDMIEDSTAYKLYRDTTRKFNDDAREWGKKHFNNPYWLWELIFDEMP